MANTEVAHDFSPFIRIYKDGRIERLIGNDIVPPSLDPKTKVESKDAVYSPENGLSCRLYMPKNTNHDKKLPLLVYFHGGGFCVETAFSPTYHNYLNTLVSAANIVAVSVDYRRGPEHALPIAYDDSWTALKWVASHSNGKGNEDWLNNHADLQQVFFAGDSAGANIAHNMGIRIGKEKLEGGLNVTGIVLVHPYFWGTEPVGTETRELATRSFVEGLWRLVCPTTSGCDDPLLNPVLDPNFASLGCNKVLVCVAEKDMLCQRGKFYCDNLGKCGWGGVVEIMEAKEEGHVFHLFTPTCEDAVTMLKRVVSFVNQD
ncbi:Abhydrolase_3 domain-containing protein [Cephalotus follicularis]|uniref:Abhydrolase_3 domain-containing protein n=1 Tax=Cephalotus follicularis TaxID=3775 RepID=A0A1Q3D2P4_CEPFO|nr:Abhydrolase_3 domain-containing protein [Cephalotus follicularis]